MSEEILRIMIFIVHLIQQRILHHNDLKKLKQTDDTNSITAFQNFATEFVTLSTVKEREIQNSIHAINSNLNNLIIVENNDAEMCYYEAKKNKKKLQHDEYEIISSEKKENNESEKKIIKLFN